MFSPNHWTTKTTCLISKFPQGSPEWHELRKGRLTMSNAHAILSLSPYCSEYQAYLKIIGVISTPINEDMKRGMDLEPKARQWYSEHYQVPVEEVGIALLKSNPKIGASPDGLVGEDGMIEIKCPRKVYPEGKIPEAYLYQIQGNLWVLDRQWCDLVIYTTEQVTVTRFYRDPSRIKEIQDGFEEFISRYDL